jgi:hypothetical protein
MGIGSPYDHDTSTGILGPHPMRIPSVHRSVVMAISVVVVAATTTIVVLATRGGDPLDPFGPAGGGTPQSSTVFDPSFVIPASPTLPATPTKPPPSRGPKADGCVNGWITPQGGTRLFTDPIGAIRRTSRWRGPYRIVDMRYFVGPESPPSDKGYIAVVERWYIKLYAPDDLSYQGRFIVEKRVFGRGVAAVAPYDTSGFRSPDWSGFQWEVADPDPVVYPGLPGAWSGIRYDFVRGGAGLEIPGMPAQVRGCLDGT